MSETIDAITGIVGPSGVLQGEDVAARKASWVRADPCEAMAIVRPASTDEVSRVMRICFAAGQPVVPAGGMTGLVDGTVATRSEIILSLERMTAIESVDTAGSTMTVQAGVPLQAVQERAAADGLMFALDLGGRGTATIGGNISTNAGGNQVIRFGMMREQVLGLEAVLADGTVISSMNRMLKNNAGYDLKQLFIGTEGTLGIVTRAVLRLRPALRSQNSALAAVDGFDRIPGLLHMLGERLGGALTAFEVMWADFYDSLTRPPARNAPPLAGGHDFYVLIEARGSEQEDDDRRFERALEEALEQGLIVDAAVAQSAAQRQALWAIRDDVDTLMDELQPVIVFDVSLPISHMHEYVEKVANGLEQRWHEAARCVAFGHLGDGNVHFCMTVGSNDPKEERAAMEIVYRELRPYGGSISAEHGIGLEKRPFLGYSRSAAEIRLMRTLKDALDPKGLLNPGKVLMP